MCIVFDLLGPDLYKDLKQRKNELREKAMTDKIGLYSIPMDKLCEVAC